MTTFDKREEAFEQQFAHDEELKFKATARRNKLLGLWAAEKLGLTGAEAETYAKSVVMADLDAADHDVVHKIRKDFDAKGVAQSDHQISRTMDELMAMAFDRSRLSSTICTMKAWRPGMSKALMMPCMTLSASTQVMVM